MASPMEWVLKLVDKMSGPAKAAANAVKGVGTAVKATDAATASFGEKLEARLGGIGNALSNAKSQFDAVSNSIVGKMLKKAGELAVAGAELAIDASSFKEDSIIALKSIVGSQEAATALFDRIDKLAGDLGIADEEAISQVRKLMVAGFGADTAIGAVRAAADLAAARGQESAEAFTNLLSTMEAKGKFDTKAILALAKAGVRAEDVYSQLAKTLHKTVPEIQAMVKAGQIDAATGAAAAVAAVQGRFGGAGEEAANTFSKLLFKVKDALSDLFQDVDLGPLKDALKSILTAINGPAGQELKAGITHFFGAIFTMFGKLFEGPEGQARLEKTLHSAARAFELAAQVIEVAGPTIVAIIGFVIDALNMANEGRDTVTSALSAIGGAFMWLVDFISGIPEAIAGFFDSLFTGAMDLGSNIIDGLVSGIVGGGSSVIDAIVGIATSAIDAAKSALGVASPSKEFMHVGGFVSQGMAAGIANDNSAQDAVDTMVAPPSPLDAQQAGAAAAGSSSGRGGGGGMVINLTVNAATGEASDIKDAVREALEEVGEEIRFAVGA